MKVRNVKIKEFNVKIIKEDDGTYSAACSSLGVYTVGRTLSELRKNFVEALDLHLESQPSS